MMSCVGVEGTAYMVKSSRVVLFLLSITEENQILTPFTILSKNICFSNMKHHMRIFFLQKVGVAAVFFYL